MIYCPWCGRKLLKVDYDEKTGKWLIDCGAHKARIAVEGEAGLAQALTKLFEAKPQQVLCPDCYYYTLSRTGPSCSYFGKYNPNEYSCEAYKPTPYRRKMGSDKSDGGKPDNADDSESAMLA